MLYLFWPEVLSIETCRDAAMKLDMIKGTAIVVFVGSIIQIMLESSMNIARTVY